MNRLKALIMAFVCLITSCTSEIELKPDKMTKDSITTQNHLPLTPGEPLGLVLSKNNNGVESKAYLIDPATLDTIEEGNTTNGEYSFLYPWHGDFEVHSDFGNNCNGYVSIVPITTSSGNDTIYHDCQ